MTAAQQKRTPPPQQQRVPSVGFVSLGCPKALVDSERILPKLRAEGYRVAPDYAGADVVVVNTCGFLDTAKQESLDAIGEAMAENGRVIVTGCFGVEEGRIRESHPGVLAVTVALTKPTIRSPSSAMMVVTPGRASDSARPALNSPSETGASTIRASCEALCWRICCHSP